MSKMSKDKECKHKNITYGKYVDICWDCGRRARRKSYFEINKLLGDKED